jgi:hypothetical protein
VSKYCHIKFSSSSVAAIYCDGQYGLIIFAKDFIEAISTLVGSAIMPPFAPPNGRPAAAAHFHVIVRASLKTSSGVTLLANLIPPFPGPVAELSITKTPFIPISGS